MVDSKSINIATVFSGIGSVEQAFIKEGIPHHIVFACDNGERVPPLDLSTINNILHELGYSSIDITTDSGEIFDFLRRLPESEIKKFTDKWYSLTRKPNNQKETYFANYQIDEERWFEDIRLINGGDFNDEVDLFVGGSPCQAFSSNGKRGGLADTRGTLFFEYGRLISEIQPKVFIFENVQGLLVHDKGKTWNVVKECFTGLGYNIYINKATSGEEQPLLDAQNYGIPQRRKRIFLVGIRKDLDNLLFRFPNPISLDSEVNDYLDDHNLIDAKYYLKEKGFKFVTSNPTRARIAGSVMGCQKANQQFNWNGDFIFIPFEIISQNKKIVESAYKGEWNGKEGVIRKFTPRECLRLMGYPDSFKIVHNDTQTYRECGNSIVVNVLQAIINSLIKINIL